MNSLLSQLLITLAQKEAAEKELHATVESLEILVAALISALGHQQKEDVIVTVETALDEMRQRTDIAYKSDIDLLDMNIARITDVAKRR
ncbi:sigma-S stabilization anti-adapter protein IraP [Acerihabitans arboris]|uniref:Anti-adapter protein n=1 Tax=Acerihabitans arboris TaxID=2691583 RepID=A0A845SKZ3_9GAMM|nr:sigma-S stabilization anti-adapter protein IraP [Acerihabitans arboris]NDL61975.1 anti-adapter protein [Acerihabitans arboris]